MTDPAKLYARATSAYNQRNWREALGLSMQLLPQAPNHAELHFLAGLAALELQQMSPALQYLQRAANLYPLRADYATQFAKALSMVNLSADAMVVAERALALSPLDAHALDTLGVIFTRANAHERATALYERAVSLAPEHANYRYNLAKSLVFLGRMDDAERELGVCLRLAPDYWGVYLTLSQLRKQSLASNHLEPLHARLPKSAGNPLAQMNLHLALAKEYEDLADYPRAFEHLVAGKAAAGSMRHYSPRQDEALFEKLIQASPGPQPVGAGCSSDEPIFVIGMPRSGTTLVERIISSHPDVHAAGELQNFGIALKRASGSRTPQLLDIDTIERTREIDWQKLGEAYLASTRPDTSHKPRFIDKLPHNFLYLGAIANALPNARIICLRRDPMDTCLSNFRQLFAVTSPNHDYSYDLLDTGRYYILFDRLMAHWKQLFPGRILEVDYETLVDSQEAGSRQLLAFCDLPWNDACLHFEDNQAPATTASAVQVREPIYRRAVQRWKQYETQLTGLRELLESAGIALKP
ncbi:sulfotransferase [Rhodanobacter sp. B04]|uniref:tetratricopeptide repeat-containing sulfotransferase family protein n=1 Tax=Rhodanobacter sp. B04 TaxID=1945860 RepID=UPI00098731F4|nr:sulfotransferase [Rhodanobacter sp. B04]OOG65442.1 sulfotransferase [Rhodanobacter sp. B04]